MIRGLREWGNHKDADASLCLRFFVVTNAPRIRDRSFNSVGKHSITLNKTLRDYLGVTKPSEWDRVGLADNTRRNYFLESGLVSVIAI